MKNLIIKLTMYILKKEVGHWCPDVDETMNCFSCRAKSTYDFLEEWTKL